MNFIGVDLHKKSITVCVMDEKRKVLARKTLACTQTDEIREFFRQFRPFKVVVEATASYPWFVELVEPLAEKVVLANPKKLRVIAESTKKTDRLDAQVLTEFLVLDMIPESYQPTPRLRQHRALVRHRQYLQGRITSVRSKIRHILSNYNADRKDLFSANCGLAYLKEVRLNDVDRFVLILRRGLNETFPLSGDSGIRVSKSARRSYVCFAPHGGRRWLGVVSNSRKTSDESSMRNARAIPISWFATRC